jgi:hypothetical protein
MAVLLDMGWHLVEGTDGDEAIYCLDEVFAEGVVSDEICNLDTGCTKYACPIAGEGAETY